MHARPEPNVYGAVVPDRWFDRATRWYLAVSSELNPEQWLGLVPKLAGMLKVASGNDIQRLIADSLYGVKFTLDTSPPSTLPTQNSFRYFELDTQSKLWEGVRRARNLAVYAPVQIVKPALELVVLLKPEQPETPV